MYLNVFFEAAYPGLMEAYPSFMEAYPSFMEAYLNCTGAGIVFKAGYWILRTIYFIMPAN